jgi:hypothetical protein
MLLGAALIVPLACAVLRATESEGAMSGKIIGMYVHQHWPYNYPYAARTWTLEDYRGYADGLTKLGFNTIMIWPVLETMPDPLTPSDRASLQKTAAVIDLLHREFALRVWIALCPNVAADDAKASEAPFERRHFFACDTRINPADAAAMTQLIARRERLLAPLAEIDGVSIIDSDPGGYPGSSNAEFVNLLMQHRKMLDRLRPGIELIYWMHVGWQGYCRFYKTGKLVFATPQENADILSRLKTLNPQPWGIANGLAYAEKLGLASKVISFSYGRIEGEPSFPMTNFSPENAYAGGRDSASRGVMGNAQTHCLQLPNTFAFARGATGKSITKEDYTRFANDLIPGQGPLILRAWQATSGNDPATMQELAASLEALPDSNLKPGPLKGLLFGSPRRFITDLAMQLRLRAAYEAFCSAAQNGEPLKEPMRDFVAAADRWQRRHGYENSWSWPGLESALRRLNSQAVNAVLDGQFNPFTPPPSGYKGSPFEYVQDRLRETESFTPRLLATMKEALDAMR